MQWSRFGSYQNDNHLFFFSMILILVVPEIAYALQQKEVLSYTTFPRVFITEKIPDFVFLKA